MVATVAVRIKLPTKFKLFNVTPVPLGVNVTQGVLQVQVIVKPAGSVSFIEYEFDYVRLSGPEINSTFWPYMLRIPAISSAPRALRLPL